MSTLFLGLFLPLFGFSFCQFKEDGFWFLGNLTRMSFVYWAISGVWYYIDGDTCPFEGLLGIRNLGLFFSELQICFLFWYLLPGLGPNVSDFSVEGVGERTQ